jgi:nucleotide-binding universal stress UspA family protein
MKTIIAPTDFSTSSINAVNYAADLAAVVNAKLVLLNVVQVPIFASEISVPEPFFEDMNNMADQDLENLEMKLAIRTKGKIEIERKVAIGTISGQISEISEAYHPFAIVMGIKAGKSLERTLLGSNTLSSVKDNPYPIMIIPENTGFTGIHKIGLACDLQDVVETIPFNLLTEWISVFHSSLDIIHLSKQDNDLRSPDVSEAISLQNHLNKFKPVFHFLTGENLSERLNEYAKNQGLDLMVVVPKKHGFLSLFDNKYSKEIIINNKTAILAVHNG